MADLGYTFEPGTNQKRQLNQINQGRLGPAGNEALKILALKLPTVLGGSPISPDDLLRPKVGGAAPGGAVLDSLQASNGPAPAPLLPGGGSGLSVAKFNPFGTPSDLGDLGQLANNAVNPPGAPTIIPGADPMQQPFNPGGQPPLSAGPVGSAPGPTAPKTPTLSGGPVGAAPGGSPAMLDQIVALLHHAAFGGARTNRTD